MPGAEPESITRRGRKSLPPRRTDGPHARRDALLAELRRAGFAVTLRRGVVMVDGDGFTLCARSIESAASALLGEGP